MNEKGKWSLMKEIHQIKKDITSSIAKTILEYI
jgi:hypothetical protein